LTPDFRGGTVSSELVFGMGSLREDPILFRMTAEVDERPALKGRNRVKHLIFPCGSGRIR